MTGRVNGRQGPSLRIEGRAELVRLIVEALSEAHEDLAAAQVVSRQLGNGVYAQVWRSLCTSLTTRLGSRYDVQLIRPGRASYRVPVIGDALLFPWRPPGGHEPLGVPFGTSPTRRSLWTVQQPLPLLELTSPEPSPESVDQAAREVFEEAGQRHLRVILVAVTSDALRLRRIEWGEVALRDETIVWLTNEVLFDDDSAPQPSDVDTEAFSAGSPPAANLVLRGADDEQDAGT